MKCHVDKNYYIQQLFLIAFKRDEKDAEADKAVREICAVYEEDILQKRTI